MSDTKEKLIAALLCSDLLSRLLDEAKDAHTRYEDAYRKEGVEPPPHRWQDWYANFMMGRLAVMSEEEAHQITEDFTDV